MSSADIALVPSPASFNGAPFLSELPQLPSVPGVDTKRAPLDNFRLAIAKHVSESLGVDVNAAFAAVGTGKIGDYTVAVPRFKLPGKPIDEIYTVLGRAKQGKTERYRTFFRHFNEHPQERLVHAEGTPGMVMAVFTLPSYPLVFKLIRDRFAWPKAMSRPLRRAIVGRHATVTAPGVGDLHLVIGDRSIAQQ